MSEDWSSRVASAYRAGRLDEAERSLIDVIARAERVDGPSGRTTINARGQLAGVYDQQGRVDEALALIEETVREASPVSSTSSRR